MNDRAPRQKGRFGKRAGTARCLTHRFTQRACRSSPPQLPVDFDRALTLRCLPRGQQHCGHARRADEAAALLTARMQARSNALTVPTSKRWMVENTEAFAAVNHLGVHRGRST
ncbi:hypothetical protein MTO96_000166 [Rhipicephalus appendiculatus]